MIREIIVRHEYLLRCLFYCYNAGLMMTKERMMFSVDQWDQVIAPLMTRIDERVQALLHAPIWAHDGISHEINRDRWLQHGKDEAAIAALYYLQYPEDLPKDTTLEDVLYGFVIHDIGKPEVSADPTIWHRKRSDLTVSELAALQNHVTAGVALLKRYEYISGQVLPRVAYDIVTTHHEKLDGSGNPYHISEDRISPPARLASVIDQVVSRSEPRAYHDRTYTIKEAMEEVAEGSGVQYDSAVVAKVKNIFVANMHLEIPTLTWLGSWR